MKVSGKLSYKSAIIVNDVFFKDIYELLREYFEKPKYSAQLINGDDQSIKWIKRAQTPKE